MKINVQNLLFVVLDPNPKCYSMRGLVYNQVEKVYILTHTKNDETPVDLAFDEAIVCFCNINSIIIHVF